MLRDGFRRELAVSEDAFYRPAFSCYFLFCSCLAAFLLAVVNAENDILIITVGHCYGQDECE